MNESQEFLGREIDKEVERILVYFHDQIRKLSDFGAEVLRWDLEKQRGGDALIPPMLFIRNQIEIIESISVLIKNSLADPCNSFLRSLLETHLYLEYILQEETEKRSLSFIVWNTHGIIQLIKKTDGTSEQAKRAKAIYKKDKFLKGSEFVTSKSDFLSSNESLLAMDTFKEANEEFLRLKAQNGKTPNWFSMYNGPKDIEQLADRIQLNGIYEGLYRSLSNSVHGTDIVRGKFSRGKEGDFLINQIRLPSEAEGVTMSCFNVAIMTFLTYVDKRIPEKKLEFEKWYLTIRDFHQSLLKEKKIVVQ